MTRGERCLTEGILNTLYGKAEADRIRRRLGHSEKAARREYTRQALAIEAAERADVAEAMPPPPVSVALVTRTELETAVEAMKDEVIAAVVEHIKGRGNGNR